MKKKEGEDIYQPPQIPDNKKNADETVGPHEG